MLILKVISIALAQHEVLLIRGANLHEEIGPILVADLDRFKSDLEFRGCELLPYADIHATKLLDIIMEKNRQDFALLATRYPFNSNAGGASSYNGWGLLFIKDTPKLNVSILVENRSFAIYPMTVDTACVSTLLSGLRMSEMDYLQVLRDFSTKATNRGLLYGTVHEYRSSAGLFTRTRRFVYKQYEIATDKLREAVEIMMSTLGMAAVKAVKQGLADHREIETPLEVSRGKSPLRPEF